MYYRPLNVTYLLLHENYNFCFYFILEMYSRKTIYPCCQWFVILVTIFPVKYFSVISCYCMMPFSPGSKRLSSTHSSPWERLLTCNLSLSSCDQINRQKCFKSLHGQQFPSSSKHFKLSSEQSPAFLQQLAVVGCQKSVHHPSAEGGRRLCCT